jgi:cobalt/nickel transport system ATP-binding protein
VTDDPTAAIEVAGLAYTYPDGHQALCGVDLCVPRGQRVALLGPNGCGKTTLALHLNGIHRGDRGRVAIGDLEVTNASLAEIRRRVGVVFQDPDDQLFMPSVREDVAFGPANLGLSGAELAARVDEALAAVDAADVADRAPHHLSDGERQRVALATVLAMRPEVLVLDEPTSGLDPAGRRALITVLARQPVAQVVVTQDLPFALELCSRALIMDAGRLVADGATAELLADRELLASHRLELPYGFDPTSI